MVSLAVVGAGAWGKNHVRVALELRNADLVERVLVCDPDPSRLKPWEGKAETTTDVEVIKRARVDAVTIATPAETHFALAEAFLSEGVHVLLEKPMTTTGQEARALADLAARRGVTLMPGHIFRYHPGVEEVRRRIRDGFFGDLRYLGTVRAAFSAPRRDVGVLWSLGIHEADLYPFLLDCEYPDRARANAVAFSDPKIDEVASIFFDFHEGPAGFAFESWITPGTEKQRRLSVVGTNRSAEVDYLRLDGIAVHEARMDRTGGEWMFAEGDTKTIPVGPTEPLRAEVEDFLKAVASGGDHVPVADAASGCRAVEIIESLKMSGTFVARGSE